MTTATCTRAGAPSTALGLVLTLSACGQEAASPPPAPAAAPAAEAAPAESPGDFLARVNRELYSVPEAFGLAFDAIQLRDRLLPFALSCQSQCHLQACQGRAKFV